MGRGRISAVTGVADANRLVGRYVEEAEMPRVGAPKSDSYEGDGHAIVRSESTDVVRRVLRTMIETVKVHYA